MRILQIVPYYPPAWGYGGPPRVMFALARALVRRGHEVIVYTTDAYAEHARVTERQALLDGVDVHYFRNISNTLAWRYKRFLPMGLGRRVAATAHLFDVVHFSAVRSALHVATLPAFWRARTPYVVDAHGSLPRPRGWKRPLGWVYDRWYLVPFLRRAAVCLAQTEHEASLYRSYVPEARVEHLSLPVLLDEMVGLPERGVFRQRVGISADAFLALFLGRIDYTKGVEFLVESFAEFRGATPRPTYLVIVGRDSGALPAVRERVRALGLEQAVRFVGPMFDTERFGAYRDADVFVSTPPYWEETSMSALEALACGTPVIITEQASVPGLDESGAGVTVTYGDRAAVVRALSRFTNSPVTWARASANARRLVQERYDVHLVAEKLERILCRVARPGAARL